MNQKDRYENSQKLHRQLTSEIGKSFQLCQYQRREWKFHRHTISEMRAFCYENKKLERLQQIHYHLANLLSIHKESKIFNNFEIDLLNRTIKSTVDILKTPEHHISEEHFKNIEELDQQFWYTKKEIYQHPTKKYHHHFTAETIVLFVILSIHDVLEELDQMSKYTTKGNERVLLIENEG